MRCFLFLNFIIAASLVSVAATASIGIDSSHLGESLRTEIQKRYPDLDVQVVGSAEWESGSSLPSHLEQLTLLYERRPGLMAFQVTGNSSETGTPMLSTGSIRYSAKTDAYVPRRRIMPGESLQKEDFVVQRVDVTTGFLSEVRGLLLSTREALSGLEARSTLLEGQAVLSNAIQRIPDIKKGEQVRLKIVAGNVALVTQGIAEEPGQVNQKIRVTSSRTKRTLVGRLLDGGTVEVEL